MKLRALAWVAILLALACVAVFAHFAVEVFGSRIFSTGGRVVIALLVTFVCGTVTTLIWNASRDVKLSTSLRDAERAAVKNAIRQARHGALALAIFALTALVLSFLVTGLPQDGAVRAALSTLAVMLIIIVVASSIVALDAFTERLEGAKALVQEADARREAHQTLLKRLQEGADCEQSPDSHFDGYTKPFASLNS